MIRITSTPWAVLRTRMIALSGLAALLACTAVVSEDAVQCKSDGDCAARGPDFVNTTCNATGLCIPKPVAVTPPPPPECTKNSDCAAKGANQICSAIQQKCTPLPAAGDECTVAYGDPMPDGTVLFGLLSEIGHSDTLYFREQQHLSAAKLAFQEFFDKAGVLLPGNKKAALIACSQHYTRRVSAELANLGVKAVIGPSAEDLQKAVVETLVPAGVPSFSAWINGNPSSVEADAQGLAWLVGFRREDVVDPLNALLAEQEAKVRTLDPKTSPNGTGTVNGPVRVAVVVNATTDGSFNQFGDFNTLMDQRLSFNGKTAVINQHDPACNNCYQRFDTNQAVPTDVAARAAAILAFQPTFIIPFTDIDWGAQLLPAIEAAYAAVPLIPVPPATMPGPPRPIYLQPFLQIEDAGYQALNVADVTVRTRITGIRPLRDNSFEVFENKFQEAFPPPSNPTALGPDPNPGAGRSFETALLLLMATYAAMTTKPDATPADVVAALGLVTDQAAATTVTLNDIQNGVAQLNKQTHIKLTGLFSTFKFDPATSSAPPTWTTWCVGNKGSYTSGTRVFANGSFGAPSFCQ